MCVMYNNMARSISFLDKIAICLYMYIFIQVRAFEIGNPLNTGHALVQESVVKIIDR